MTGFPIIDRELSVRSRLGRTYLSRILLTAGGVVVVLGLLQAGRITGRTPVALGETLFTVLSLLGMAYCILAGPVLAVDCLSGEKREGTLPLLLLSSLPPSNVVIGILAACSLPAFYALFAYLPLLALPFFLGGITLGEFWRMALLLVTLLTTSLTLCGAISALAWSGRKALAASAAILLLWIGLPWAWTAAGRSMPLAGWFPDPLSMWLGGQDQAYAANSSEYFRRIASAWFASGLCLVMAVLATPRFLEPPYKRDTPSRLWFRATPAPRHRRPRERWYALNPVAWLARRRSPLRWPIIVFGVAFGGTALAAIQWSDRLMNRPELFITYIFCLHGLLKLWLAWELSRCLSRDNAEGLLEPLLAAPLSEHQIVHGWITGLQTVFRGPVILLVGMDLAVWTALDLERWRYPVLAMMGVLLFDAFTLLWAGLYFGLTARNATRGLLHTIFAALVAPWIIGLCFLALLTVTQIDWFVPRSMFSLCLGWIGIGLAVDAALCFYCSRKLGGSFRHLVAEKR